MVIPSEIPLFSPAGAFALLEGSTDHFRALRRVSMASSSAVVRAIGSFQKIHYTESGGTKTSERSMVSKPWRMTFLVSRQLWKRSATSSSPARMSACRFDRPLPRLSVQTISIGPIGEFKSAFRRRHRPGAVHQLYCS